MQTHLFGIILLVGAYLPSSDPSSWESLNTTHIIIDDISQAFLKITNNTEVLSKLIPEMYNLNVTDPPFVFKLPQRDGAVLLIKRRSDFLEPQFPNLTTSNTKLMVKRRHTEVFLSGSQGISPHNILMDHTEATVERDVWLDMGLEGWSGEISEPIIRGSFNLDDINRQNADGNYFSPEILNDRNSEPTTTEIMVMAETDVMEANEENERVYLARANDPFGYSTSWELRNSSELSNSQIGLQDNRAKRDVVRLYSMIKCSTGCEPLLFQSYGCYCGFLGSGFAVDGIDRCCKLHDKCYEHSNCISYLEYFVPYIWKCYRGKPLCAVDHGEWGSPRSCAAQLCYCDMRLSRCLRNFECPRTRPGCKSSPVRQLHRFLFP